MQQENICTFIKMPFMKRQTRRVHYNSQSQFFHQAFCMRLYKRSLLPEKSSKFYDYNWLYIFEKLLIIHWWWRKLINCRQLLCNTLATSAGAFEIVYRCLCSKQNTKPLIWYSISIKSCNESFVGIVGAGSTRTEKGCRLYTKKHC